MEQVLDNVTIVLVDTKTPANIGAAARCMMNMGLSRLALVRAPKDPKGDVARLAAGADKILEQCLRFDSLRDAIAGQSLVFGTTRHTGRLRRNMNDPRQAAAMAVPLLVTNPVCIVFGNEVNGLEKADLSLCQEFITIPSSPAFPSLNLSHAVMVVAYEFFVAARTAAAAAAKGLAPAGELEQFYEHLESSLKGIGFLNADNAGRMMFSLRQLFGRARLDHREAKILRGILTAMDKAANAGKSE